MHIQRFIEIIPEISKARLGGTASQFKFAPVLRKEFDERVILANKPRKAAVLALFYPDKNNNTKLLLTERADYKGTHAKQISFPGGKSHDNETFEQTALRETFEEVGINQSEITIIRELSQSYIPPSNFLVFPYIGVANKPLNFTPNYEVASILEIELEKLLEETSVGSKIIETSYMKATKVPVFNFENKIVWGATAMILSEIKDLLKDTF